MLGLTLAPGFPSNPWVYVYFSDRPTGRNELVRIRADGNRGGRMQHLFTLLPASAGYHNGGDIAFGPDGKLYVVTGEIHEADRAQNINDLGGKVLRLNPNGTVPPGDPFGRSNPVWSYGHRNSFGLCFDPANGQLWETENGPTSDDEVNQIVRGANYGWPVHLGAGGAPRFHPPALVFPHVIVPTGCAFWAQRAGETPTMWFGDFGGTLHRTTSLPGGRLANHDFIGGQNGITDVEVGPDGNLYFSTMSSIERIRQPAAAHQAASPSSPAPGSPSATSTKVIIPTVAPGGRRWGALAVWFVVAAAVVVALAGAFGVRRGRRGPANKPVS